MRQIIKGSKEYVAMRVNRRGDDAFDIESAEYFVRVARREGAEVVDQGTAEVEGKRVFFLADTTKEEYTPRRNYHAYFRVQIDGMAKVLKGVVSFVVIE